MTMWMSVCRCLKKCMRSDSRLTKYSVLNRIPTGAKKARSAIKKARKLKSKTYPVEMSKSGRRNKDSIGCSGKFKLIFMQSSGMINSYLWEVVYVYSGQENHFTPARAGRGNRKNRN